MLAQYPALTHLDLSCNFYFGAAGAERLAGVLGQCRELVHLNLAGTGIEAAGAESLAGVLGQCQALAHLDLTGLFCQSTVTFFSLPLSLSLTRSLPLPLNFYRSDTHAVSCSSSLSPGSRQPKAMQ